MIFSMFVELKNQRINAYAANAAHYQCQQECIEIYKIAEIDKNRADLI